MYIIKYTTPYSLRIWEAVNNFLNYKSQHQFITFYNLFVTVSYPLFLINYILIYPNRYNCYLIIYLIHISLYHLNNILCSYILLNLSILSIGLSFLSNISPLMSTITETFCCSINLLTSFI